MNETQVMEKTCIYRYIERFKMEVRYHEGQSWINRKKNGFYNQAKNFQTKKRNLWKALQFYAKAAKNGEKVNSCIKDFASVVHQLGFTEEAVQFLESMRDIYDGDAKKYNSLLENFKHQLQPSGKHFYKFLLIDLINVDGQKSFQLIENMFSSTSRIKGFFFSNDLNFQKEDWKGRYLLIEFQSFSAGKKTLETFKADEWFGVDKYWVNLNKIVICEAINGQIQFQNHKPGELELIAYKENLFRSCQSLMMLKKVNEDRISKIVEMHAAECERLISEETDIQHF